MSPKVFLVTGCSTGFGKYLVQEILDKGDICVATARNPDQLKFDKTSDKVYDYYLRACPKQSKF